MTEPSTRPPAVEFRLDPASAGKRPDQLVNILTRALRGAFPESVPDIEVIHSVETGVVRVMTSDAFDEERVKRIVKTAYTAYKEFVTSPWY